LSKSGLVAQVKLAVASSCVSTQCAPGRYRPLYVPAASRLSSSECLTKLKSVACVNRPAAGCRSFYSTVSRRCRRAAMQNTSGHPACRSFAVSRLGSFMPQFSPLHASGSYQGQAGSPFSVTAGLLPNKLASLEASSRLATARFSSAGLLPYAFHLGFPARLRWPFHRTSDPRAMRSLTV
jgi:hypothetical protein